MQTHTLEAIESELAYQQKRWPNHKHSPPEWLLIMEKCLRDAKRVWLEHGDARAMDEVRQIVAVGVAAMDQCGAPKRADYPTGQSTFADLEAKFLATVPASTQQQ